MEEEKEKEFSYPWLYQESFGLDSAESRNKALGELYCFRQKIRVVYLHVCVRGKMLTVCSKALIKAFCQSHYCGS